MNSLPPIHTFAPVAGMSLAELSAAYDHAIEKEAQFRECANNPQWYRAECQAAVTELFRANVKACVARQVECLIAYRALRALAA